MADQLLISGANVFNGVDDDTTKSDVLIRGEQIVEVKPHIDADATRFDGADKWMIPGLIDMHVHILLHGMESLPVLVGNGVTTIRDLGGDVARLRQVKLDIDSGKVVGPELVYSGPALQGYPCRPVDERRGEAPWVVPLTTEDQAEKAVRGLIEEQGVRSIKVYETVRPPIMKAILAAATDKVPVTGHLGKTPSAFAIEHGIGGVEHLQMSLIRDLAPPEHALHPEDFVGVPGYMVRVLRAWSKVDPQGPEVERWLSVASKSSAFVCPTVTASSGRWPADDPRYTLVPTSFDAVRQKHAGDERPATFWLDEEELNLVRRNQRSVMQAIHEAGIDLVVGTDATQGKMLGWSLHDEISALQRRGLTPFEALRAGTSVAAKHLWRDDLGVIAAGKRADLVLLDANPTTDVANISGNVSHVVKNGRLYESDKLLAIAEPDPSKFYPLDQPTITRMAHKL